METWLGSDMQHTEINIPSYELVPLDRVGMVVELLATYIASHLPFTSHHSLDLLWLVKMTSPRNKVGMIA